MPGTRDEAPEPRVHAALQRVQKHPVPAVLIFVATVLGLVGTFSQSWGWLQERFWPAPEARTDPYAPLAALSLDSRLEYFEETFGVARSTVDVCADGTCPEPPPQPLQLVVHETDDVVVRGLFAADALAAYTVTTKDETYTPPVRWVDRDLGQLGTRTTQEILDGVGAAGGPLGEASVRQGTTWLSYVDVFPGGAPADYRGLILAWTVDGVDSPIDVATAGHLADARDGGGPDLQANPAYARALTQIRATTRPNTYGEYRDDGPLAAWLQDPENVQGLLFEGSEA